MADLPSNGCPRRPHLVARGAHRLDDVLIAGAATEIGREHVEQLLVIDIGILLQRIGGQHQEARRAEAALQRMMRDEGALQRMQVVGRAEPFDGADVLALRLYCEHQAGAHRLAINDHRAGAADAMLAADMRAGLPAIVADGIDQRLAWLDPDRVLAAVDGQRDVGLVGHRKLRGSTSLNFLMMRSSSASLLRTTIGNVSRRLNGLQASMTTRALRGSSALYAIGSSAVLQQPRRISIPSRGSKRVHI